MLNEEGFGLSDVHGSDSGARCCTGAAGVVLLRMRSAHTVPSADQGGQPIGALPGHCRFQIDAKACRQRSGTGCSVDQEADLAERLVRRALQRHELAQEAAAEVLRCCATAGGVQLVVLENVAPQAMQVVVDVAIAGTGRDQRRLSHASRGIRVADPHLIRGRLTAGAPHPPGAGRTGAFASRGRPACTSSLGPPPPALPPPPPPPPPSSP